MAIYRADQAIVTFAAEAAQGGIPEGASAVTDGTGDTLLNMSSGLPAGSRSITVDSTSGITAGEFIQIGPDIESETNIYRNAEVRRVEFVEGTTDGTLHLDTPTAFFHVDNSKVQVVTAVTDTDDDKIMTFIPGVYETVDVPDPEMTIEPRYLLGTSSNRNYYTQYKSSQSYSGGIGSFTLLNGWPLRFPIGKITSIPDSGTTLTARTDLNGNHKKGDMWINVDSATNLAAGDLITIDYEATPTSTSVCEVRRLVAVSGTTRFKLNYPLQFDHTAGSSSNQIREIASTPSFYQHDIFETVDLDSISWNVLLRDSSGTEANDLIRRYFGGKVGSTSISASEEGMLTMSWDGITFLGMNHNQADHTGLGEDYASSQAMPGFGLMQTIDDANMTGAIADTDSSRALRDRGYPTTNPYFFSNGTVSLFGTDFARVRDFNISIDNAVESRYYISTRHGKLQRGPSETREGQRSYNMSATLALPDSTAATADTATLFKELLLEGDYGTNASPSNKGFNISLTFTRATNDSITISIPADGVANAGGNGSGAFLTSATHNVGGSGALEVDASMIFRNMKIQIKDSVPLYP